MNYLRILILILLSACSMDFPVQEDLGTDMPKVEDLGTVDLYKQIEPPPSVEVVKYSTHLMAGWWFATTGSSLCMSPDNFASVVMTFCQVIGYSFGYNGYIIDGHCTNGVSGPWPVYTVIYCVK